MKPYAVIALTLLSGCSNLDTSSFNTGGIDYTKLKKNPPVNEVRLYQFADESGTCPLQQSLETPATLALTVIGYGAKELIAYGKSELEKRAEYLESDVKLNGRGVLTTEWPPATPSERSGLCLLLVAGEFSANSSGDDVLKKFGQAVKPTMAIDGNTGLRSLFNQYELPVPGLTSLNGPFTGLNNDPSFMVEVRVTTTKTSDGKTHYVLAPTYLVYPEPLHKMTTNGPRRKIGISVELGDATAAISLDDFQSGGLYDASSLKTRYAIAESASGKPFGAVAMVVTEGPDKLPTAKVMRDLAAQQEKLDKAVDDKIAALIAAQTAKEPAPATTKK